MSNTSDTSGSSGTSGTSGAAGTSGASNTSGTSGSSGSSGVGGAGGISGGSGTSGTSGNDGTSGSSGTSGTSGVVGGSGNSITITTENDLLIDGGTSAVLDQSRTLNIKNPFGLGTDRTDLSGFIHYTIPNNTNRASGEIFFGGVSAAATITAGEVVYLSSTNGWAEADAGSVNSTKFVGLALSNNPVNDGVLLKGPFASTSYTFPIGSPLYISTSGGGLTDNVGTFGSGDYVRIVAYQLQDRVIYFDPDNTWVELP